MAPYMAPWSVRASAVIPCSAARCVISADAAQAVEEAELGVDVEVDEVASSARVRGSQGHPAIVAMRGPGIR